MPRLVISKSITPLQLIKQSFCTNEGSQQDSKRIPTQRSINYHQLELVIILLIPEGKAASCQELVHLRLHKAVPGVMDISDLELCCFWARCCIFWASSSNISNKNKDIGQVHSLKSLPLSVPLLFVLEYQTRSTM